MTVTRYRNVEIFRHGAWVTEDLWVDESRGVFINPMQRFYDASDWHSFATDREVDCAGLVAAPGFIDLQFNGAFGVDFSSPSLTVQQVLDVAHKVTSTGVTSFYPTVISCAKDEYVSILRTLRAAMAKQRKGQQPRGAKILGFHLEGPFFSHKRIGAHNPVHIKTPNVKRLGAQRVLEETYGDLAGVKLVTLAPELEGVELVIGELKEKGVLVSMGHCNAKFQDGKVGVERGARMITHVFNAMAAFHHRDPGLVGLLGAPEIRTQLYYGIIVDGIHCHPSSVSIAFNTHPKGLVLVTDAMSMTGLGLGSHKVGSMEVEIVQGPLGKKAVLKNQASTLAGSVVTFDECLRNLVAFTGCSREYAIDCATKHPALCMQIHPSTGTLQPGCTADFVLLNKSLHVNQTFVAGVCVFKNTQSQANGSK